MKKKTIAVFLAVLMFFTVFAPAVCALDFGVKQTTFNGHTYVLVDEAMTWKQAKAYCEARGGYLATITSQAEQDVIVGLITGAKKDYYWLGATDEETEGEWKWITGEAFSFFGPAKTFDDAYDGEDYLQIYTNYNGDASQLGYWNDNNNETYIPKEAYFFETERTGLICEIGDGKMPSDGSRTAVFNGHTYTAFDTSLTWKEAEKFCKTMGGHLATVTSEQEQKVIESIIKDGKKDQYWLGGSDEKKEREWTWVTGEPFTYWANLISFDNSHGGEDFLQIQTNNFGNRDKFGYWNDVNNENYVESESYFYSLPHTGFILEKGDGEMPIDKVKTPVIYVKGRTVVYSSQGKKAIDTSPAYIADVVEKYSDLLVKAVTLDRWDEYCNTVYKEIADKFEDYRLNNDGEVDNGSYVKYKWKESSLSLVQGDIFTYLYEYDCRIDPCRIARELHEYIEAVKRSTGSDTVHIVARCLGCNIATAYLAAYGWDDIESFVFYNSAALGYDYISDSFSGNVSFNSESLDMYCEQNLDSEDVEDDAVRELVKAIINNARILGLLKNGTVIANKILANVKEKLIKRMILATYGTCPGYWCMVNDKRFEEAKAFVFGEEANTTYKKLVEKIDNYHYNVMNKTMDMVKQMDADGVDIYVICKYGLQTTPFVKSSKKLSDDTVDVYSQSFFGATCANTGHTLTKDHIKNAAKNGLDRYISPDKQIDSSTALFPDRTWYIKYYDHSNFYDCFNEMLMDMCYSDGEMTVFSDARYPQYTMYDHAADNFYPLTEETEEPYQYNNSFFGSVKRIFQTFFNWLRSLFIR